MRNKEVAEAFLLNRTAAANTLWCVKGSLFSYTTCIAQLDDRGIIGNATKYSTTTSRHLGYIRDKVTIWTTKPVPRGAADLLEYL